MYTHQTLSTAKGLSFMWTLLHQVLSRWALSGGIEPNSYSFTPNNIRRILLDLTEDPCKIKTAIMGRRVQKQLKQIPPVAIVKIPH